MKVAGYIVRKEYHGGKRKCATIVVRIDGVSFEEFDKFPCFGSKVDITYGGGDDKQG